jgi:hypothetical protein
MAENQSAADDLGISTEAMQTLRRGPAIQKYPRFAEVVTS